MAAIFVGDKIKIGTKAPNLDARYGPWSSKLEVIDIVGRNGWDTIAEGLTVGIYEGDEIVEYWFKKPADAGSNYRFTQNDLVKKLNQNNVEGAELLSNKVTSIRQTSEASNISYPSEKAVASSIDNLSNDIDELSDLLGDLIGDISFFNNNLEYNPDPNNPNVGDILRGLYSEVLLHHYALGGHIGELDAAYFNNTSYLGYSVWRILSELFQSINMLNAWKQVAALSLIEYGSKLTVLENSINNSNIEYEDMDNPGVCSIRFNIGNGSLPGPETITGLVGETIILPTYNGTVLRYSSGHKWIIDNVEYNEGDSYELNSNVTAIYQWIVLPKYNVILNVTNASKLPDSNYLKYIGESAEWIVTPHDDCIMPSLLNNGATITNLNNGSYRVAISNIQGETIINCYCTPVLQAPIITLTTSGNASNGVQTFNIQSNTTGTINLTTNNGTLSSNTISVTANIPKTFTLTGDVGTAGATALLSMDALEIINNAATFDILSNISGQLGVESNVGTLLGQGLTNGTINVTANNPVTLSVVNDTNTSISPTVTVSLVTAGSAGLDVTYEISASQTVSNANASKTGTNRISGTILGGNGIPTTTSLEFTLGSIAAEAPVITLTKSTKNGEMQSYGVKSSNTGTVTLSVDLPTYAVILSSNLINVTNVNTTYFFNVREIQATWTSPLLTLSKGTLTGNKQAFTVSTLRSGNISISTTAGTLVDSSNQPIGNTITIGSALGEVSSPYTVYVVNNTNAAITPTVSVSQTQLASTRSYNITATQGSSSAQLLNNSILGRQDTYTDELQLDEIPPATSYKYLLVNEIPSTAPSPSAYNTSTATNTLGNLTGWNSWKDQSYQYIIFPTQGNRTQATDYFEFYDPDGNGAFDNDSFEINTSVSGCFIAKWDEFAPLGDGNNNIIVTFK